jgi:hypothetical protein
MMRLERSNEKISMANQCHIPSLEAKIKATSKNVIPAKAGIQKGLRLLDSRLLGSDKLIINRGPLKN